MELLAWHIWMILGIIFVIIEIFDPAFFFVSLGIGAIVTGLLALIPFMQNNILMQILCFAIFSFIAFLFMRKIGKKVLVHSGEETNVFALKGKVAHITIAIPIDGKGYVKVGSEEWVAVSEDNIPIDVGEKVIVTGIDGNKLIVKKDN
ncbi:MAG: NfeD family protein [Candidatus Cloacimonetes bacterium]|jgi:membrane protein implicated in regulation of membrane protease activity|nr:NfeD family protein [Candidatus Cloacimonadota bacterium]MDY0298316.1 NfeD family protein [Candidatus Cloacimonadaceae bacterium]MCB5278971.1 NfeD family protein [Candidatus Cloacimonadota bacterium]MCK9332415.1 NfeD family protein [Candidatus Cloacimonadota bacterium]MDD2209944.1 NfeD family protein [Candidatus Cloacimonadota bacterium]